MHPVRAIAMLAAAAALVRAAADDVPRVCPACDHEVGYEEAFCHNCGGDLSGVPVPGASAAPEPEPEPAGTGALADAIRADVAFSRSGRGAMASLAALRNAAALARLDPAAVPAAALESLRKRTDAFFASCSREVATCPLCGGRGTLERKKPPKKPPAAKGSLEASVVEAPKAAKPYLCALCGGHGKAPRVRDRRRMLDAMLLGARDYRRAAAEAGREESGGLMLPAGWSGAEPPPARPDCTACAGTGTVPCRACGGFGRVACADAAAHVPPAADALKADRGTRIEDYQYSHDRTAASRPACASCGGAWDAPGAVACPACGGRGLAACTACGGSGHGR
ncbi:MAG: hypothetical protein IJV65_00260 [Kiritimatiellae bacterium]|nr:hypothetical protein [Kiritimatiellia bacterium]